MFAALERYRAIETQAPIEDAMYRHENIDAEKFFSSEKQTPANAQLEAMMTDRNVDAAEKRFECMEQYREACR